MTKPLSILMLALAGLASGQRLSEDSLHFAHYWSLVESGDSLGAQRSLLNIENNSARTEALANFLLAWRALQREDDESVPVYLELGVPADLQDHASWMRATALDRAGQQTLAATHWTELALDQESIYRADALQRLAELARERGDLDSLFAVVSEHSRVSIETASIQQLELISAEILSDLGRHTEAVDRLWGVYNALPTSDAGKRADYLLRRYPRNHNHVPRAQSAAELELELDRLADAQQLSYGLQRAREKLEDPLWAAQRDLLLSHKGRFQSRLRQHRDALESLRMHADQFPDSPYRSDALYRLAYSAYLRDQDALAIATIDELTRSHAAAPEAGQALKLLGLLHLDRGRPQEASDAFRRWREFSRGKPSETESLWRWGRALWQSGKFSDAADVFGELAREFPQSSYHPVALYWTARAAGKADRPDVADSLCRALRVEHPYSYYSQLVSTSCAEVDSQRVCDLPAIPLDNLWSGGGPHSRKLALLSAARLPALALKEWRAALIEADHPEALYWWKVQLHLWDGDRLSAWRSIRANLGSYIICEGERPQDFSRTVYPLDFDPRIRDLAGKYGLDPYFVAALICQESHYEEKIESPAGAIGLMQLMPATARKQANTLGLPFSTRDLYTAQRNLEIGVAHLAELDSIFSGDSVLVMVAYNAGKSVAQAWFEEFGDLDRDDFIENIPYRETRLFVKRIIEHTAAYRRLYPDLALRHTPADTSASNRN